MTEPYENEQVLAEILKRIGSIATDKISVSTLSSKCGYSIWHLQRLFHALTGQTLGSYLRARRLTEAAQILARREENILEIALDCGFTSHEAFSRSFKSNFGQTPKEVRLRAPSNITMKKPALTTEYLKHLDSQQLEPTFINLPARYLAGIETKISSPLNDEKSNYEELPLIWGNFKKILPRVRHRKGTHLIGLAASADGTLEQERLSYIAACEIEVSSQLPEGFRLYEIPSKDYAVFINRGKARSVVHLTDYIYGTWLPNSQFARDDGADFEVFYDDYVFNSDHSVTRYHVPVKKKVRP